jgi:hypothetical protein
MGFRFRRSACLGPLQPGQLDALKRSLLGVLRQKLCSPGSTREQLWDHGLVCCLLAG